VTDDEAIKWLQRRTVVVLFHQGRIVLAAPRSKFTVNTQNKSLLIHVGDDYTLAMSDPGDSLGAVVAAARASWRDVASPVDALADVYDQPAQPAKLDFVGNINSLLGEISG
jgi:hypothetical protein